jgi:hypothetical protein
LPKQDLGDPGGRMFGARAVGAPGQVYAHVVCTTTSSAICFSSVSCFYVM